MNSRIAVSTPILATQAAAVACQAAIAHAEKIGIRINVAVTDVAGTLVAFLRMSHAFLHSIDIAIDKAYTAASFRFPTEAWGGVLANDEALRLGIVQRPRLVVFGGGLPVSVEGEHLGGIGVSGGSAEEDAQCAQAGIDALLAFAREKK